MTKVGVIPSEDGNHMEWTISLETKGYYDASGSYISDRLNRYVTSETPTTAMSCITGRPSTEIG